MLRTKKPTFPTLKLFSFLMTTFRIPDDKTPQVPKTRKKPLLQDLRPEHPNKIKEMNGNEQMVKL